MKKKALLVVVGLLAVSAVAFAKDSGFAIGAEASSSDFNGWGGRFVFHFPRVPLYFGIGAIARPGSSALDFTMDYWLANSRVTGIVDYYIGLGAYLALASSPDRGSFALGARLPIGLQIWPLRERVLEIFLEIAPAWIPISSSSVGPPVFEAQPAIGFRIWL